MVQRKILVIDDDLLIREGLKEALERKKYHVTTAETGRAGLGSFLPGEFDLILLDYSLPDMDGLQILKKVKSLHAGQTVIMMTGYSSIQNAVTAMKMGVYDYIQKPFDMDEMLIVIAKALETVRLRREVEKIREGNRLAYGVHNIIGKSPQMGQVIALIRRIAGSGASTILITGESGTGKGLVARAIHTESPDTGQPFLNITCTALPENLLESELFGHEKGAFTDAKTAKKGLFETAEGGTVFLDEIGDMSLGLQAKLLRFLEEKSFRRLGGIRDIEVKIRIIAATNRDLGRLVKDGQFRMDLYYRLNVIPIHIPPLRERPDDIPELTRAFIRHFNSEFKKKTRGFNQAAMKTLKRHSWPGNIRELRNMVERLTLLSDSTTLTPDDLPYEFRSEIENSGGDEESAYRLRLPPGGLNIHDMEKDLLHQAIALAGGNKTKAGKLLGLNRDQVRYWLKKKF
jgi:two-component system, NtrC family, response regulator AtoC